MLLTIIKNNTKLLLRSKISFIFMCLLPIMIILILSNAFSSVMGKKVAVEKFTVGYRIEENSEINDYFSTFKQAFEENGITLKEMKQDEGTKALLNGKITSYVVVGDKAYTLYNKEGIQIHAMIFESTFKSSMQLYDGMKMTAAYVIKEHPEAAEEVGIQLRKTSESTQMSFIKPQHIEAEPVANASDYYGIVQIVFFIWFSISPLVNLADLERKNKISERMKLANIKPSMLFLGKLIPNVFATCIQLGIAIIVSKLLLKINWGNVPALSAGILLAEVIAVSAFGTMLTTLFKNSSLITMGMYISAFVLGYTGGSFETYMYNSVSEDIVKLSPLYYLNRSLVELTTKGHSTYVPVTLWMLLIITGISFAVGLTYMYTRREA